MVGCDLFERDCTAPALRSLECFFEDEIEAMLCGSGESWTVQSLSDGIKFDHGYTLASSPVKCFLEVLSELNGEDQKRFLRFVTGESLMTACPHDDCKEKQAGRKQAGRKEA